MFPKTFAIILAGCTIGIMAISVSMLAASGWETPGKYSGMNNAAHPPLSKTNCYPFQTGCENTQYTETQSNLQSGTYLSGNSQ